MSQSSEKVQKKKYQKPLMDVYPVDLQGMLLSCSDGDDGCKSVFIVPREWLTAALVAAFDWCLSYDAKAPRISPGLFVHEVRIFDLHCEDDAGLNSQSSPPSFSKKLPRNWKLGTDPSLKLLKIRASPKKKSRLCSHIVSCCFIQICLELP